MAGKTQEGAQHTRYLLGGGSEAERERLEKEFFADDDTFQEMLTAEDDLIDAYARGELSGSEKQAFEKRFLKSIEGRERVQFARAFAAKAAPRTLATEPVVVTPAPPGFLASVFGNATPWRTAFAVLGIAMFAGFLWLLFERSRMNTELNALHAERDKLNQQVSELQRTAEAERARSAELQAQINSKPVNPDQSTTDPKSIIEPNKKNEVVAGRNPRNDEPINSNDAVIGDNLKAPKGSTVADMVSSVSFELTPGTTRGGQGNVLPVPANAKLILLTLPLENESTSEQYRVVIERPDGRAVKTVDVTLANPPHTSVAVPAISAREMRPGDYVVSLTAKKPDNTLTPIGSYSFRIVRK